MEREEFIKILASSVNAPYVIEGEKIIVGRGFPFSIFLNHLTFVPDDVQFEGGGNIHMTSVEKIGERVLFKNSGRVLFKNSGGVGLLSLSRISRTVRFDNELNVIFRGDFGIDGINHNKILNKMISLGLFDRKGI